jgi:uncharacterized protein (DUF2345 family)
LLNQQVKDLQQAVLLASAPAGMALTTGGSLHAAAGQDIALTAQRNVGISAMQSLMVNIGQAISLFAAKAGIKLYANQGNVDIQAQGRALLLSSRQDTQIRSLQKISLAAQEEIVLSVGGNAVRITAEGIRTLGKTTVYGAICHHGASSQPLDDRPARSVGLFGEQFRLRGPQRKEWHNLPVGIHISASQWAQGSDRNGASPPLHAGQQQQAQAAVLWHDWGKLQAPASATQTPETAISTPPPPARRPAMSRSNPLTRSQIMSKDNLSATSMLNNKPNSVCYLEGTCQTAWSLAQQFAIVRLSPSTPPRPATPQFRSRIKPISPYHLSPHQR